MVPAIFMLIIGGAALARGIRHRRPGLVLLGASVLVCHALPVVMLDPDAISATMRAHLEPMLAIALVASLAWCMGYWLFARRAEPCGHIAIEAPSPLLHGAVLLALIGIIAAAPGGLWGFAQSGFLRLPVERTFFSLTYATACLAGLTTTLAVVSAVAGSTRPPWFSVVLVMLVFWLLGGRTQLAITALGFALVFLDHGRVRLSALLLPGLVLAALAGLTLSFRLNLQGEATGFLDALPLMLGQLSLLESYALAARFAEEFGHRGVHYWETVQQVLPRALFPEKPLQLSKALRLMEDRDTLGGLTPGLAGEAFATAGLIGVAGVGLAFGGALALLDNLYLDLARHSLLAQALVVSLIPLLAIFVLRGGFDTAIFRLAILGFAAGLVLFWQRAREQAKLARTTP